MQLERMSRIEHGEGQSIGKLNERDNENQDVLGEAFGLRRKEPITQQGYNYEPASAEAAQAQMIIIFITHQDYAKKGRHTSQAFVSSTFSSSFFVLTAHLHLDALPQTSSQSTCTLSDIVDSPSASAKSFLRCATYIAFGSRRSCSLSTLHGIIRRLFPGLLSLAGRFTRLSSDVVDFRTSFACSSFLLRNLFLATAAGCLIDCSSCFSRGVVNDTIGRLRCVLERVIGCGTYAANCICSNCQ